MVDEVEGVFKHIEQNRNNRLSGQVNAIPFYGMPAFSRYIPGIQQGRYYIIAAPQKGGKTSLADNLFLYGVIKFLRENPNTKITVKIKYYSLELSKEQKILSVISRLYYEEYGEVVSPEDLLSLFEDKVLNLDSLARIRALKEDIQYLLDRVDFIEDIRNPVGIIKDVEAYMETVGKFTYKTIDFKNGKGPQRVRDKFIKNDPDHYVIVVTDHLSLLQTEKNAPTIKQAIDKFSSDYCIKLRNRYNCVVVNVQQMSAQSQTKEYHRGEMVIDKLLPAATDLAESRITGRDANVLIAIFDPHAYGVEEIDGYDIKKTNMGLKDNFRQILILLNRNGRANAAFSNLFAGPICYFKELPPPNNAEAMRRVRAFVDKVNN